MVSYFYRMPLDDVYDLSPAQFCYLEKRMPAIHKIVTPQPPDATIRRPAR